MDLLEATSSHPSTPAEQPFAAEEDRVGPSDFVEGAWGASPVVEPTGEVTCTALEVPVRPSTAERFHDDGTGSAVPPTLDDARLQSSRGLEKVDAAEPPPAADDARVTGGVVPWRLPHGLVRSSGRTDGHPELGLFLRKGSIKVALGYGDFLRGIEELKALPLKERRRHMKNRGLQGKLCGDFVVYLPMRGLTLISFSELGTYLRVTG